MNKIINQARKCLLVVFASVLFTGVASSQNFLNFEEPYRIKDDQMIKNSKNEFESWGVGGFGDFKIYTKQGKIEKRISKSDLNSIYVFDDQKAFVTGTAGELLFTKDRGENWQKIKLDTKVDLTSIFWLDENTCWVVGNKDGVFISGGINKGWKLEKIVSDRKFEDVYFVNEKVGFAVGENNLLLKTDNGGKYWTRISLSYETSVGQFFDGVFWFEAVSFLNEKVGCVTGWDVGKGIVACTKDQGKTWKTTLFDSEHFIGIVWTNKKEAHLIGEYGRNFFSKDLGITWVKVKGKQHYSKEIK
ncbi:MAG: YCF48-related protein [Acidobacteriota bacterium]|nr:YCF48-related protein [Acidobacteriota bacterium]